MSKLSIHSAARAEIYDIAVFLDACWKAEYSQIIDADFLGDMSVGGRHKMLLRRFDGGTSDFLVMRDEKGIAGASVLGKSSTEGYPDDGEISALYLRSDCIGRGYGHVLFTRTEAALAAKGYRNFVLDVLAENHRAIRFYLAHGYAVMAESKIKLGNREYPLMVMRKNCLK